MQGTVGEGDWERAVGTWCSRAMGTQCNGEGVVGTQCSSERRVAGAWCSVGGGHPQDVWLAEAVACPGAALGACGSWLLRRLTP